MRTSSAGFENHVDSVHPEDHNTDEQLRDWMGTAAYTRA